MDVLAFLLLLVAVPAAYLFGFYNAKKAMTPKDSWSLHEHAKRINLRINREWSEAGPLR